MSPSQVLEPTYRRIKSALKDGTWPGGTKLEAMRLADDFGVSMTPVRDSLNRLVGEGLVDLTPGEGFRVPVMTEQRLREMLAVNAALVMAGLDGDWTLQQPWPPTTGGADHASRLAAAFSRLAMGSGNRVLGRFIAQLSDRLHPVRACEPDAVPEAGALLRMIEDSLEQSATDRVQAVERYHRQCLSFGAALTKCLDRSRY